MIKYRKHRGFVGRTTQPDPVAVATLNADHIGNAKPRGNFQGGHSIGITILCVYQVERLPLMQGHCKFDHLIHVRLKICRLTRVGDFFAVAAQPVNLNLIQKTWWSATVQRDLEWLESADAVIAEVTNPSLGVGYELGMAEKLGKPILCLYEDSSKKRKLSAMVSGNLKFRKFHYHDLDHAKEEILSFIDSLS